MSHPLSSSSSSSSSPWADDSGQVDPALSPPLCSTPPLGSCELDLYPYSAFPELPHTSLPPSICRPDCALHIDSSPLSSSTEPTLSALPASPPLSSISAPPPPSRKRRVRGLTEEQRTARRRSLHRDIDATRRSREAAAISRLHGLLQGHKQALLIEDDRGVRSAKSAGAGRVRVLEQCAEVIERLQSMRQAMERASNAKDQQLRILADHLHSVAAAHAQSTLACIDCSPSSDSLHCEDSSTSASASPSTSTSSSSSPLSALPAPLSATLSHLHRSSSLRADSTLGSSSLCVLVKLMPSSVLVSASARFCQQSGYREQDLVGTTMTQEVRPGTCPLLMQRGGGDRGEEGWGRGGATAARCAAVWTK